MSLMMHAASAWTCGVDWEVIDLYLDGLHKSAIADALLRRTMGVDAVHHCTRHASRGDAMDGTSHSYSCETSPCRHGGNGNRGNTPSNVASSAVECGSEFDPVTREASFGMHATSQLGRHASLPSHAGGGNTTVPLTRCSADDVFNDTNTSSGGHDSTPQHERTVTPTLQERLVLTEYVEEQLQCMEFLETHFLPSPYIFVSSTAVMLPMTARLRLISRYYSIDEGLAELWFGDRLSRIDVEDDDLLEVGLPGLREPSVKRQWRNIKRVCKFITAAYRGRDGLYIPRDTPLTTAIQQSFVLPIETAHTYAALVFGFEHRLDSPALERFEMDPLRTLCSALGACWCDASNLVIDDRFCKRCWHLGKLLDDKRVVSELSHLLFGSDAPRLLRQIKDTFDEVQKAMMITSLEPAALSQPGASTAQPPSLPHSTGGGATASEAAISSPETSVPSSGPASVYNRRFAQEFAGLLKQISKLCIQFSSSERLRDMLGRFYAKIYEPLLILGQSEATTLHMSTATTTTLVSSRQASSTALEADAIGSTIVSGAPSGVHAPIANGSFPGCVDNIVLNHSTNTPPPAFHGVLSEPVDCPTGSRVAADGRRYVRDLCTVLGALPKKIGALPCLSGSDHSELDSTADDVFAILRLFSQLLLAHE